MRTQIVRCTVILICGLLPYIAAAEQGVVAIQQAALPPEQQAVVQPLPNAIACREASAAKTVASAQQDENFISAKELIVRYRLDGLCGTAHLPDDFKSPKSIADEGANISAGNRASDGRQTLIYELPIGHERNHEGFAVFIVLLP